MATSVLSQVARQPNNYSKAIVLTFCMTTTFTNGACVYVLIFLQGFFIENLITDSAIYRTKIHSYLLDRVCYKKMPVHVYQN